MTSRIIAKCHEYTDLMDGCRLRIAELGTTGESVDAVAGLPERYSMKLLGPNPTKIMGRVSFGLILSVLGMEVWLVENKEKLDRIHHRLAKSVGPRALGYASGTMRLAQGIRHKRRFLAFRGNPELARVMRQSQILAQSSRQRKAIARGALKGLSAEQRSENARRAANARWAKYREDRRAA